MITRIEQSGIDFALKEAITTYVDSKLGRLDRFMSWRARRMVHIDVKLLELASDIGNRYTCEAIMHLPGQQITAKDSAHTMNSAVDGVEAKLKTQLSKSKVAHGRGHRLRHQAIFKLFSRQTDASESIT